MPLDGHHLGTCHPGNCHWHLRRLALGVPFTSQQVSYQTTCTSSRGFSSTKAPSQCTMHIRRAHYGKLANAPHFSLKYYDFSAMGNLFNCLYTQFVEQSTYLVMVMVFIFFLLSFSMSSSCKCAWNN